jgi:predicted nucleic-acid-binding Zn-ribbon protein
MGKTLMIKCKKCNDWFQSPIQMDEKSFMTSTLTNNTLQCPRCGNGNVTNKEDMKFI